jgi:hypothetical protein
MTTVVDPLGTPTPIFNRSGTAIVHIDGLGTSSTSGNVIPAVCGHVIALVNCTENNYAVRLPDDAEIGSVVEAYVDRASTFSGGTVFSQAGETIGSQSAPSSLGLSQSGGILLRKVSDTGWMAIV